MTEFAKGVLSELARVGAKVDRWEEGGGMVRLVVAPAEVAKVRAAEASIEATLRCEIQLTDYFGVTNLVFRPRGELRPGDDARDWAAEREGRAFYCVSADEFMMLRGGKALLPAGARVKSFMREAFRTKREIGEIGKATYDALEKSAY